MNDKFQKIKELAEEFIKFNELNGAHRLFEEVNKFLDQEGIKESDPQLFDLYQNLLAKLKVFSINFFEEDDYFAVVKNNFEFAFEIPNYDFWEKIKLLLMLLYDFNERNELKNKFKKAVADCRRPLINRNNYSGQELPLAVGDWIRDFVVNLGADKIDPFKKQEYLANSKFLKALRKEDQEKVRNLLNIYEKLNLPSTERDGMENSVPMEVDKEVFVLDQGEVVNLDNEIKAITRVKPAVLQPIISPPPSIASSPAPVAPKPMPIIPPLSVPVLTPAPSAPVVPSPVALPIVEEAKKEDPHLQELKKQIESYPLGSLERRALEAELKKISQ